MMPIFAMSDQVWLQLIALGNKAVDQVIPALTLIAAIVGVYTGFRNHSKIGQVQTTVDVKAEEIKDSARNHAETAAVATATAVRADTDAVASQLNEKIAELQSRIESGSTPIVIPPRAH